MTNNEAKKFVEAVYKDIWSGSKLANFDKYYAKDTTSVAYLPNGQELEMDYTALKKLAEELANKRYNVCTEFETVIGQKDTITVKYKQRSINRETNQVYCIRTAFQYELKNGKINKCWAISNSNWTF